MEKLIGNKLKITGNLVQLGVGNAGSGKGVSDAVSFRTRRVRNLLGRTSHKPRLEDFSSP